MALISGFRPEFTPPLDSLLLSPSRMREQLRVSFGPFLRQIVVTGVLEDRLVLLERADQSWVIARLNGRPLMETEWSEAVASGLSLDDPQDCVATGEISPGALFRLTRPRVILVALCHPVTFPLPRFPLGISDLARAIRRRFQGEVTLLDMQLGLDVSDILREIACDPPDILGLSATFGQHDLLEQVVNGLGDLKERLLLVFGGSLCALNADRLLARYPSGLVAHGPGEVSLYDIVEYWHGDRELSDVRGIGSSRLGPLKRPPTHRDTTDFLPELDLLETTLALRGVMQLESSRGCTHACSFCPRDHKGIWAGEDSDRMVSILQAISEAFDDRPEIARKIFLVDEEFIGADREGEGPKRALELAARLWSQRFRWETSSRVDQVYRPDKDKAWHTDRMTLWTRLRERGLDRCLFGLESGVDSVLKRFNKQATARQNILAVRLLTACGIPIRCTYITFDPLMSADELVQSYHFQGRRDLLLAPQRSMTFETLFDAVHDDAFAEAHALGTPLYDQITYMLVSMECLLGSPYLRRVEAAGLAREEVPSMGRRNALFLNPVIGVISNYAQRWVDRNFSLDYLLKSLEKISVGQERFILRRMRALLKESSYALLGRFLDYLHADDSLEEPVSEICEAQRRKLGEILNLQFEELATAIEEFLTSEGKWIPSANRATLQEQCNTWISRRSWELINE